MNPWFSEHLAEDRIRELRASAVAGRARRRTPVPRAVGRWSRPRRVVHALIRHGLRPA